MKNKIDRRTIKAKEKYLGNKKYNNQGLLMEIIDYKRHDNITIKFEDGTVLDKKIYGNFKRGAIENPFYPHIHKYGYYGIGNHTTNERIKYDYWKQMLWRCYSDESSVKCPTYTDCTVYYEWHNYQNYGDWYDKNFYAIPNETMCMDKDILKKNNKLYSPETCVFVPRTINNLFTNRKNERGECLIGVTYIKKKNKYQAQISKGKGKRFTIGYFNNEYKAFIAYKKEKESYIKQVADDYKNVIPTRLYEAMYSYEVNEDD